MSRDIFADHNGSKRYLEALPGPRFIVASLLPGLCLYLLPLLIIGKKYCEIDMLGKYY